jgi:hypothetical protein
MWRAVETRLQESTILWIFERRSAEVDPHHPYTRRLMAAAPSPDPSRRSLRRNVSTEEALSSVRPLDYVPPPWWRSGQTVGAGRRHTIQRQPPFSKAIARPWVIGASAAFAGGTPAMSVMRARATPPCETTNASPVSRSRQGRTRSASIA